MSRWPSASSTCSACRGSRTTRAPTAQIRRPGESRDLVRLLPPSSPEIPAFAGTAAELRYRISPAPCWRMRAGLLSRSDCVRHRQSCGKEEPAPRSINFRAPAAGPNRPCGIRCRRVLGPVAEARAAIAHVPAAVEDHRLERLAAPHWPSGLTTVHWRASSAAFCQPIFEAQLGPLSRQFQRFSRGR